MVDWKWLAALSREAFENESLNDAHLSTHRSKNSSVSFGWKCGQRHKIDSSVFNSLVSIEKCEQMGSFSGLFIFFRLIRCQPVVLTKIHSKHPWIPVNKNQLIINFMWTLLFTKAVSQFKPQTSFKEAVFMLNNIWFIYLLGYFFTWPVGMSFVASQWSSAKVLLHFTLNMHCSIYILLYFNVH